MFESIRSEPGRGERARRVAVWAALGGVILVVGSLVLANASSPFLVFAAIGLIVWLPLFFFLYRLSAQFKDETKRLVTRSVLCAIFWAPSLILGHGAAPAPAIVVLFLPDHFLVGAVPLFAVAVVAFMLLSVSTRNR